VLKISHLFVLRLEHSRLLTMGSVLHLFIALLFFSFAQTSPVRRALTPYAPVLATCPATPLVRNADRVSASESSYISSRYTKAAANLVSWAKTTGSFNVSKVPVVALTTSGGGYRSLLEGAGIIQGFDKRDSQTNVSGVFQGLTYHAGLSGGAWLLSSFAGNNYPTITSLRQGLWQQAFQNSLLIPGNLLTASTAYAAISADLASKGAAGFPPTLTDPWGRLLSYQFFYGPGGGVSTTLSGLTAQSNFTSYNVPYPIITALGVKTFQGECLPGPNATQYEFHPYEFGSWDDGVNAFTQTTYIGTSLSNGKPTNGTCIRNYDNLGYVLGTSSSLFNQACAPIPPINSTAPTVTGLFQDLAALVNQVNSVGTRELYAVYPNPFRAYPRSSLVAAQNELSLVDGGEAFQNNPIWPLLHRAVDVILVNDNSADTNNFPNGSALYTSYQQARDQKLTRMPVIPTVDVFLANGYNKRPTFFGCNDNSKTTIIYIPNYNYTYPSNQPTAKLQYTVAETDAMIANGVQIATKGGDKGWPLCLACGIMKKAGGSLPSGCASCFTQYCYN
jgi:lysophospholipase